VEPREAAIRFWLDPIPPEEMPMLAARMLAEGHDTPALRWAAGCSRRDGPRDIREEFGQALDELGAWRPDRAPPSWQPVFPWPAQCSAAP
jgi:hypothetical protein